MNKKTIAIGVVGLVAIIIGFILFRRARKKRAETQAEPSGTQSDLFQDLTEEEARELLSKHTGNIEHKITLLERIRDLLVSLSSESPEKVEEQPYREAEEPKPQPPKEPAPTGPHHEVVQPSTEIP